MNLLLFAGIQLHSSSGLSIAILVFAFAESWPRSQGLLAVSAVGMSPRGADWGLHTATLIPRPSAAFRGSLVVTSF